LKPTDEYQRWVVQKVVTSDLVEIEEHNIMHRCFYPTKRFKRNV